MTDITGILDVFDDIKLYAELYQLPELMKSIHHAQATAVAEIILDLDEPDLNSVVQAAFPPHCSSC